MGPDLENAIIELSLRMRLLRAIQEEQTTSDSLAERDLMILDLLEKCGQMTVSQIAEASPNTSGSTISTNISKLWRNKMVSKTIKAENQRTTIVELTEKGKQAVDLANKQRTERFRALFQAIDVTDEEKQILLRVIARAVPFFDKHLGLDKSINK